MNGFSNKAVGLVAVVWLAVATAVEAQVRTSAVPPGQSPPPEIKLNGLTTILGDKRALFKVRNGSGPTESYLLAEGQSAGAIRLLAVDIRAGRIKVSNHGVVQTIALCDPPDLSILMASEISDDKSGGGLFQQKNAGGRFGGGGSAEGATVGGATGGQNVGAGFLAGNKIAGEAAAGTANDSPGAVSGSNPVPADTGSSSPDTAGTGSNPQKPERPEPYSLTAAREFERLRIQTASGVYNGTDEPLPLTPLTPPGTPKALIGPDRAWFPD